MATLYTIIYVVLHLLPQGVSEFSISSDGYPVTTVVKDSGGWVIHSKIMNSKDSSQKIVLTEKGLDFPDNQTIQSVDLVELTGLQTASDWSAIDSFKIGHDRASIVRSDTGAKIIFEQSPSRIFTVIYTYSHTDTAEQGAAANP